MSTPTHPTPGPVAYRPVDIPESAAPIAGEPSVPGKSRRLSPKTLSLAAGALVILGVGSFFALNVFLSPSREEARSAEEAKIAQEVAGPEHVVLAYLDALADGNARGAWVIASGSLPYEADPSVSPDLTFPQAALLIDNASYQSTESLPSDPEIDDVAFKGNSRAIVTASYELDGSKVTQEFELKHGATGKDGVVPWRFASSPIGQLDIVATGGTRVLVNGVDVSVWVADPGVVALPAVAGTYQVQLIDVDGNELDAEVVTVTTADSPVLVSLGG